MAKLVPTILAEWPLRNRRYFGLGLSWRVVEDTYWDEVSTCQDRQIIDYVYVIAGSLAYLARVASGSHCESLDC